MPHLQSGVCKDRVRTAPCQQKAIELAHTGIFLSLNDIPPRNVQSDIASQVLQTTHQQVSKDIGVRAASLFSGGEWSVALEHGETERPCHLISLLIVH